MSSSCLQCSCLLFNLCACDVKEASRFRGLAKRVLDLTREFFSLCTPVFLPHQNRFPAHSSSTPCALYICFRPINDNDDYDSAAAGDDDDGDKQGLFSSGKCMLLQHALNKLSTFFTLSTLLDDLLVQQRDE